MGGHFVFVRPSGAGVGEFQVLDPSSPPHTVSSWQIVTHPDIDGWSISVDPWQMYRNAAGFALVGLGVAGLIVIWIRRRSMQATREEVAPAEREPRSA